MSAPLSLRWGVLMGAGFWTVGLFVLTGVAATTFVLHYPDGPRILHDPFRYVVGSLVVALACMTAGLFYVRRGLSALTLLRTRLARVREGGGHRLTGAFPEEVQPLVDDLNALLDHREDAVRRALSRAGDLAHGLKTPLAVIAREVERHAGGTDRLDVVGLQVERMRRQVGYHLAHARASASGALPGASCDVAASAGALVRTLERLHADRGLTIRSSVAAGTVARAQREDLEEMLGNLLDNACTWGRTRVDVSSRVVAGMVEIGVDDDGPGVPPEMRSSVLRRGVRADEAAPGSGLGLSIVADLAELYGGAIVLDTSPLGGTRARLTLPEATSLG